MSIGNCVVEKKGYTQEDFEKRVTTDLLAQLRNELEFSCIPYEKKELPYVGEDLLNLNVAEIALAQGKLKVGYFALCSDRWDDDGRYRYDYELEFEIVIV